MKDYQNSLEKLRKDAAENRLIADLATNKAKRETFAKLADHLSALADEVERRWPQSRSKRIDDGQNTETTCPGVLRKSTRTYRVGQDDGSRTDRQKGRTNTAKHPSQRKEAGLIDQGTEMKFATDRPFADPEAAACKQSRSPIRSRPCRMARYSLS